MGSDPKIVTLYHQRLRFIMQDAMDELNGRAYDGRDLRIRLDEGRPRSVTWIELYY